MAIIKYDCVEYAVHRWNEATQEWTCTECCYVGPDPCNCICCERLRDEGEY